MKDPKDINVLIGCEESQAVCIAFRERGFNAFSCDILETSGSHPEWHIKDDVLKVIYRQHWDLLIGHPPCTYLSYAATSSWNNLGRCKLRLEALDFFRQMWEVPIKHICLENPKSCASPTIAKYSQVINPYFFGDEHIKTTWLWLKNLPKLISVEHENLFYETTYAAKPEAIYVDYTGEKRYFTDAISGRHDKKTRSKTFPGIANAMAQQWGDYLINNL